MRRQMLLASADEVSARHGSCLLESRPRYNTRFVVNPLCENRIHMVWSRKKPGTKRAWKTFCVSQHQQS
jgi:hypothetical protein